MPVDSPSAQNGTAQGASAVVAPAVGNIITPAAATAPSSATVGGVKKKKPKKKK